MLSCLTILIVLVISQCSDQQDVHAECGSVKVWCISHRLDNITMNGLCAVVNLLTIISEEY